MDTTQSFNQKNSRNRLRCYSSMSFYEYEDYFGTPPKMPQPPNSKPLEDPLDIPFFLLETEITEQQQKTEKKSTKKLIYHMDVIPEVDSSDANSIGFRQSQQKQQFFKFNNSNAMEDENEQIIDLIPVKRNRYRQRSYSQNNLFLTKTKIIDFLHQFKNKGRKQVKIQ